MFCSYVISSYVYLACGNSDHMSNVCIMLLLGEPLYRSSWECLH